MEQIPSAESVSSNSITDEIPRKLTRAEKKALYKPTYGEPHETRRKVLKDVYMNEKDDELKHELVNSILFSVYEVDENPYMAMLQLHKICPDYSSNKPKSLAGLTAYSLQSWLSKQEDTVDIFNRCVSKDLQMEAFRIATAKHTAHLKLFKDIFFLDKPQLLPFIREEINLMVKRHLFKEAMDVVEEFELHREYGLHDFVIPCVLQDKLSLVVKYMENDKEMQGEFISYLDSFVGLPEKEVISRLKNFKDNEVMTVQYERFTGKTIEKMIYKLVIELMLPIDSVAPNLFRARNEGELRYKVQSRFYAQELSDDAYFGHVSEALREGDEQLRMYFINYLTGQRKYEDAVRWAVYCNIGDLCLPRRLLEYIRSTPNAIRDAELNIRRMITRAEEVGEEVMELLPGYPIVIVKNWGQLQELIHKLENESQIGIDSEWKPQYMASCDSVALLQIAITDGVYLVDFCLLEKELVESQWNLFLHTLLCNSCMKIGFDLTNDLRALFTSPAIYPLRCIQEEIRNVVCLKLLVQNLLEVDRRFFDMGNFMDNGTGDVERACDSDPAVHIKLSELSEKLLGIKLDKSEQCSNWAMRPLRISQKRYAAMDAYIVIGLFSKLKTEAESRGMDFHALVQSSSLSGGGRKKEKIKSRKERVKLEDMTWSEICEKLDDVLCGTRKATELQCIVDSMLFGLGKNMRRCGVNVLIPENRHELKCKASEGERIILTSGKAYGELRPLFADRVFCIPNICLMNSIEQLKFVFTRYKVTFSGLDVFSRCMDCNSTCIVKAPGIVIQALFESVVTCRSSFHDEPFDVVGWSKRLSSVDPQQYCGIGCQLIFCNDIGVVVECCGGTIDIIANVVTHDHLEEGVETIIKRVPEQIASRSGNIFYICGSCGKIYWEADPQEVP